MSGHRWNVWRNLGSIISAECQECDWHIEDGADANSYDSRGDLDAIDAAAIAHHGESGHRVEQRRTVVRLLLADLPHPPAAPQPDPATIFDLEAL